MEEKYRKITPEEIFISYQERELTKDDRWMGRKQAAFNRPSGNNFIDLFATLVHNHGHLESKDYAERMGVSPLELNYAFQAMTGMLPAEWSNRYLLLATQELLRETTLSFKEIADRLGFLPAALNRLFFDRYGVRPRQWRLQQQKGGQ